MNRREVLGTFLGGSVLRTALVEEGNVAPIHEVRPDGVQLKLKGSSPQGHSCTLELNGQDISRFTKGIVISAPADGVVTASVEVFPKKGFDLSLDAVHVNLTVIALPGFALVEEALPNGLKRWTSVRDRS